MKHQSGEEEKRKKRLTSAETGSQRDNQPDVLIDDEIDPARYGVSTGRYMSKRENSNGSDGPRQRLTAVVTRNNSEPS